MIPPRPNLSNTLMVAPGVMRALTIYERIEAKLDHVIDCIHAETEPATCPECQWAMVDGVCPNAHAGNMTPPEPQEVS